MRKSLIAAFAFVGLTLALLSPSLALEKITLAQGIPQLTPAFAFSSSVPTELGFFKEEGLEVEVATTPGTAAAMQLVVGKRVDVAMVVAMVVTIVVTSVVTSVVAVVVPVIGLTIVVLGVVTVTAIAVVAVVRESAAARSDEGRGKSTDNETFHVWTPSAGLAQVHDTDRR